MTKFLRPELRIYHLLLSLVCIILEERVSISKRIFKFLFLKASFHIQFRVGKDIKLLFFYVALGHLRKLMVYLRYII